MQAPQRRGPSWVSALLVLAAFSLGAVALQTTTAERAHVRQPRSATVAHSQPITLHPPWRKWQDTRGAAWSDARSSTPRRLSIPTLDVDAPLVPLELLRDGSMEVPQDAEVAGWYAPGPQPGEAGPAVIAGHVDSRTGPGVFVGLSELLVGDNVTVENRAGQQVVFRVVSIEQHPKSALPVQRIWANTTEPTLRLVTCGGRFNQSTGHYSDNVVVFAEMVSNFEKTML